MTSTIIIIIFGLSILGLISYLIYLNKKSKADDEDFDINENPEFLRLQGQHEANLKEIELKEKFIKIDSDSLGFEDKDVYHSSLFNDTVNALTGLGYKPHHAKKACSELEEKGELQGPIEDIIKKALNQLMS